MVPTTLLSGIPTTVTSQFIPEPAVDQAVNPSTSVDADVSRTVKEQKKPDLTKPIEVTDHMEVVVNGKKCLLKVNPETGQLCAYPLVSTGKWSPVERCVYSMSIQKRGSIMLTLKWS